MKFLTGLLRFSNLKREDDELSAEKPGHLKIILAGVAVLFLAILGFAFFFYERTIEPRSGLEAQAEPLTSADRALFQAVRAGNAEEARRSLREGGNAHAVGESGTTPFRSAIALNHVDVVRELISARRDNDTDRLNSLLVFAIVQNRPQIVRELAKLSPDVNSFDRNGYTPLLYAIDRGHVNVARELLNAGADANALGKAGVSPLIAAVARGRTDMVAELLEAGADWRVPSPSGETAVSIAERRNRDAVVGLLMAAEMPTEDQMFEEFMRLYEDMGEGELLL